MINVDNTRLEQYGIAKVGSQSVEVEMLNGPYKNKIISGHNLLMGKMELDTVYTIGDKALVTVFEVNGEDESVTLLGYYRISAEIWLLSLFAGFLVFFAGWIGFKAFFLFFSRYDSKSIITSIFTWL